MSSTTAKSATATSRRRIVATATATIQDLFPNEAGGWGRLAVWLMVLMLLGTIVGIRNFVSPRSLFLSTTNNKAYESYRVGVNLVQPRLPPAVSSSNKPRRNENDIQILALIGERNSGTTWMTKELTKCYNTTTRLHFQKELTRYKHQFQYYDPMEHADFPPTVVIAEVRDPYQWMLAMVDKPRYSHHRHMDWKTFVTTPWTTTRAPSDDKYANTTERVCHYKYTYREIISCEKHPEPDEYVIRPHKIIEQSIPVYEMNPKTFQPYSSVIELRRDKILNHIEDIRSYPFVKDVLVLRYEDLVLKGTQYLHDEITRMTGGVKPQCEMVPPQPQRENRKLPPGFREWMDKHTDWTTEAKVGYRKLRDSDLLVVGKEEPRSTARVVVFGIMALTLVVGIMLVATSRKRCQDLLYRGNNKFKDEEMTALALDDNDS